MVLLILFVLFVLLVLRGVIISLLLRGWHLLLLHLLLLLLLLRRRFPRQLQIKFKHRSIQVRIRTQNIVKISRTCPWKSSWRTRVRLSARRGSKMVRRDSGVRLTRNHLRQTTTTTTTTDLCSSTYPA